MKLNLTPNEAQLILEYVQSELLKLIYEPNASAQQALLKSIEAKLLQKDGAK